VVEAIALDSESVLPVSSPQTGKLGIKDISLSLPTRVGRAGILEVLEPSVSLDEREALHRSAESLKEVFSQIK
jgi:L-lactate dehydrogenase